MKREGMQSFTADQVRLGFIGVGAMGSRIVKRLRDRGYQAAVYDSDQNRAAKLSENGAYVASSLKELAEHADVILSCLPNDEAVRSVYFAEGGVFAAATDKVVLEMTTVSPHTSRELHDEGAHRGIEVVDVPIVGSTSAVEQGTITLLAGGDIAVFQAAKPIFGVLAQRYFLVGPSGSGTSMKLVVNTILGIGMQAIAEAIALGEAEGLDRKMLFNVLSQTAMVAPIHKGKLESAEHGDYSSQFAVGMMNKEFRLILEIAKSSNLELPATTAAFQVNAAAFKEDPAADFSCVVRYMEKMEKAA
jgi:3-hydroxyisobutyrate dehydrogenase-like beta-hydroxyacid dehydrogenase